MAQRKDLPVYKPAWVAQGAWDALDGAGREAVMVRQRQRLVEENVKLVSFLLGRMKWLRPVQRLAQRLGWSHAMAEGYYALVKSARHFDPACGWKFTAYVSRALYRDVLAAALNDSIVRGPKAGPRKRPSAALAVAVARTQRIGSLDMAVMDAEGRTTPLSAFVRGPADDGPPAVDDRDALERVWALAESVLEKKQRVVLEMRYRDGLTMAEAAAKLGRTRENVRQIERRALARLRAAAGEGGVHV